MGSICFFLKSTPVCEFQLLAILSIFIIDIVLEMLKVLTDVDLTPSEPEIHVKGFNHKVELARRET